ncbi:hypothetical protein K469DRAFT_234011 [Zopfia rhizophila CBS 207.26]|uniref:Uncharacterized protein n=1 Tax=Zopfia rhizophila CBS 207.26 TaxID=1314779 RepID=A0A6A6D818_9PEZI|nr:hypothetical protein K469DRAFT_234011 [Zopfia rhizophila CBS 207.26]
MMQTIDIWSFSCVLSVAATWVVLGFHGIWQYTKLSIIPLPLLLKALPIYHPGGTRTVTQPSDDLTMNLRRKKTNSQRYALRRPTRSGRFALLPLRR